MSDGGSAKGPPPYRDTNGRGMEEDKRRRRDIPIPNSSNRKSYHREKAFRILQKLDKDDQQTRVV